MVPWVVGLALSIIGTIIGLLTKNWLFFTQLLGVIGIIALLVSALISGVFIKGDRIRANYWTQTEEHKQTHQQLSLKLFLFGIPNLMIAIIIYVFLSSK